MKGSVAEKLLPQQSGLAEWLRRWRTGQCALCVAVLLALLTGVCAAQKTIHVPADVATIQGGIDAAANGDTVLVSPGTYFENIDFKGKAITVTSGAKAYSDALTQTTIIDGGGKGPVASFHSGEHLESILSGFTIRNGTAVANGGDPSGGGVWIANSAATILNNAITGNQGCGIGMSGIANMTWIYSNDIANTSPGTVKNGCGVSDDGAGIAIVSAQELDISFNVVENNMSDSCGGGIVAPSVENLSLSKNTIRGNQAPCRPGMDIGVTGYLGLYENLVYGNSTTAPSFAKGAGIAIGALPPAPGEFEKVTLLNNTVFGNTSMQPVSLATAGEQVEIDGVFPYSSILANNLVISANNQEALNCGAGEQGTLAVENNDVFNLTGQAYQSNCAAGGLGSGGLSIDPLFVDASGSIPDLHLQAASPAIDTGDFSQANDLPSTDLDGNPRTRNRMIDMGVYEFQGTPASKTATTGVLTASQSAVNYGQAVAFTLKVSAAGGTPTGTAQFFDGPAAIGSAPLLNGIAVLSDSALAVGSHSLTAQYSGDGTFAVSVSNAVTVVVNGDATTVSLNPAPNPDYAFQPLTMTAMVTSAAGTPTGTVNFLSSGGSGAPLGTGTLSGGVATATTSALGAGIYSLTAQYLGGGNFASGTSPAVKETVLAEDTSTGLTGTPNPAYIGQTVTFTATVAPKSGVGTPTGTVTFHDGGTLLGPGTLSAGVATFSTAALTAGSHSIMAVYGGDANFNASVSPTFKENVAQIGTTVTLASSGSPSYVGQSVTFTATVVSSVAGVVPTGSVTFSDEAGSLGNGTLSGSGVATLPIATLPVGTHTVIAAYGGFNGLAGSASQPVQQVVQPLAFTLEVSPTTLTLKTQNHGVVTVTVTPGPGLTGAVGLRCGALPALATCGFSSTSVDVSGGSAQTSTLTVDTDQLQGYGSLQAARAPGPGLRGLRASALASLLPAGMLLLLGRTRLRGGALRLVAMLAIVAMAGMIASCSGQLPASTPPGTYTIPVTGQAANGLSQTVNLTLVVTQ